MGDCRGHNHIAGGLILQDNTHHLVTSEAVTFDHLLKQY